MFSEVKWCKPLFIYNNKCSQASTKENPNLLIAVGTRELQGPRPSMEDAACIILDLESAAMSLCDKKIDCHNSHSFFCAVFDGHKGAYVSRYIANELTPLILSSDKIDSDPTLAMREGILNIEQMISNKFKDPATRSQFDAGATCTSVMLKNGILYCANVGDSRSVLSRNGNAIDLSIDQKPSRVSEYERVTKLGGQIHPSLVNSIPFGPDRVWPGGLALSRALGDFDIKTSQGAHIQGLLISPEPELRTILLDKTDDFIIIACDGVWDVFTSHDAVIFTNNHIPIAAAIAYAAISPEDVDTWYFPDNDATLRGTKDEIMCYSKNAIPLKYLPGPMEDEMTDDFWETVASILAELLIKYALTLYSNDNVTATIVLFKRKGVRIAHPRGYAKIPSDLEVGNDGPETRAAHVVHRELDPAFC